MSSFFITSAYPWLAGILCGVVGLVALMRQRLIKQPVYRYSLGVQLKNNGLIVAHYHRAILYVIRALILLLLALVISKPEFVDYQSRVPVQGIDIVLVLDVSGSMQFQYYTDDNRSRFDVAKAEAIHFIEKRSNDALGLVLFGKDTLSRCPITSDKKLLKSIVEELQLGIVGADGTMLITGIITAANRLKHSASKSKVMIVLTDGEPSEGDMDPALGIDIAKRLGIKVYTIGIGNEEDVFFMHAIYGLVTQPKVNKELLTSIARATGGQYFLAHKAEDMRRIYDTIDALEKTDHEVPMFSVRYDMVTQFMIAIMSLVFLELLLSTFIWFAL